MTRERPIIHELFPGDVSHLSLLIDDMPDAKPGHDRWRFVVNNLLIPAVVESELCAGSPLSMQEDGTHKVLCPRSVVSIWEDFGLIGRCAINEERRRVQECAIVEVIASVYGDVLDALRFVSDIKGLKVEQFRKLTSLVCLPNERST